MVTVRGVLAEQEEDGARSLLISAATGGERNPERRERMRRLPLDELVRLALDNLLRER